MLPPSSTPMEPRSGPLRFPPVPRCVAGIATLLALTPTPLPAAEWTQGPGHRWIQLPPPASPRPGFFPIEPALSGLAFTNSLDELTGAANRVLYNGAGVATGDYDRDGLPDVFLCNLHGENALFRNLGGFRFRNVTREAGLGSPIPFTRGAVFADINGDGPPDLLLTVTGRGTLCFLNDGRGRFSDTTAMAGTASRTGATTLALADVDGNGTLDLYVTNYRPDDVRDLGRVNMVMVRGRPVLRGSEPNRFLMLDGRLEECGQPDQLLLNDGTGRFRAASWTDGTFLDEKGAPLTEPPPDWGLTATFRDLNADGAPDLYVCNDYWTPDRCWINDGKGRFRALPSLALRKTPASSMGVDFSDIDRDGHLDFFIVDMLSRYPAMRKRQGFAQMLRPAPVGLDSERRQVMRNTLLLNRGDGTYAEIAAFANLAASDWSWSPAFLDVDLDGYDDLLIAAGHFRDVQDYDAEARVQSLQHDWKGFPTDAERQKAFTRELMEHYRLYPKLDLPLGAFRNRGDTTFEELTEAWGLNTPGIHQGLAFADFDGDGDADLVVNALNSPARIFRHEGTAGRLSVRLAGRAPNTEGIGARVSLRGGAVPLQSTEVLSGGRYQSGSDPVLTFATGTNRAGLTLEVRWRDGGLSTLAEITPGRHYVIEQPALNQAPSPAQPESRATTPAPPEPLFEDASAALAHAHIESAFNDEERQPLLPFRLSQAGPGVAWMDLDGDGHDDLVLGAGQGGSLGVRRGDGTGKFRAPPTGSDLPALADDSTGLVAWNFGEAASDQLLAALSGYQTPLESALSQLSATNGLLTPVPTSPQALPGGGALAVADPTGQGKPTLFVAGGVRPGQYPLGTPSRLLRWENRRWVTDDRNSPLLDNLGIVNGAVWSDLDGDGSAELVLACEWGPIRVFAFRSGLLHDLTRDLGLADWTGWWRGVTAVDLNNDGRMDLVASNWGLNSPYRATPEQPLTFAYGQIAQPGVTEILETEYVNGTLSPRRQLSALARSLPFLLERFPSHSDYSEATLAQVLGDRAPLARKVRVTTLASTAFLNTETGFKTVPLPREAQFAPAFAVVASDFDGDGNEDIFLSQNFSCANPEIGSLNAGLGLLLRGDGQGNLSAVPAPLSGLRILGDQRGAATADYDEDGRPDLVVSQNGAETRLFRNRSAKPGLRIRLKGPHSNPRGVGAVLRAKYGDRSGPAREIHAGSGYWSQDSVVQILPRFAPIAGLSLRWPGGKVSEVAVPGAAREISVDTDGKVQQVR